MIDLSRSNKFVSEPLGGKFMFNGRHYVLTTDGLLYAEKKPYGKSDKWVEVLSQSNGTGLTAQLTANGDSRVISIPRNMMSILAGDDRDRKWAINYRDGDHRNCRLDNLEWVRFYGRSGKEKP